MGHAHLPPCIKAIDPLSRGGKEEVEGVEAILGGSAHYCTGPGHLSSSPMTRMRNNDSLKKL